MDAYTKAYYRLYFQNKFLSLKANAFQDLFADIMSRAHPNDFIRCRPWGNIGDRKNDGYLPSERRLFQVYAPNEMTAAEAVEKIKTDFEEALPHWEAYFDKWTFVHNAASGLGPHIIECLLSLGDKHKQIRVSHLGYEGLEAKVLSLSQSQLEALLGYAPDIRAINNTRSADLIEVLDSLALAEAGQDVEIKEISPEKINKNNLSEASKIYLRMGQLRSRSVGAIIDAFPDPLKGDRIVQVFRTKYTELKLQDLPSDRILSELIRFTGGYGAIGSSSELEAQRHEVAVASILSYLFERCDIFEDPEGGDQL